MKSLIVGVYTSLMNYSMALHSQGNTQGAELVSQQANDLVEKFNEVHNALIGEE